MHSENTTAVKTARVAHRPGLKPRSFPTSREVSMKKIKMADLTIAVEDNPTQEDIRTFIKNLVDYNASQVGEDVSYPIAIFIRDSEGKIVGGLVGKTSWEWMLVSHLWVSETLRFQGYGRELMLTAEAEAKKRGCHHSYLDTFSFQALGFYQKIGYQIFGILEDFPRGHQRYFLQKRNL